MTHDAFKPPLREPSLTEKPVQANFHMNPSSVSENIRDSEENTESPEFQPSVERQTSFRNRIPMDWGNLWP